MKQKSLLALVEPIYVIKILKVYSIFFNILFFAYANGCILAYISVNFFLFQFQNIKEMDDLDRTFMEENGFEFMSVIGHGSFGVIYQVFSRQYNMDFALKRVLREKFMDNEIECMIAIRSSSIVPLFKYFYYDKYVYLVMEYCPSTVEKAVKEELTILKQYQLALGMAMSVQSCHEFQIGHCDIKPSNFLLDKNGRVKICDFGMSKKINLNGDNVLVGGTILFLAPEILSKHQFDPLKADIWALGVSFFYLVTGKYPWAMESQKLMLQTIHHCIYDEGEIPDLFFKQLIKDCLSLDPSKRPTATDIVNSIKKKLDSGRKKIVRPHSTVFARSSSLLLSPGSSASFRLTAN